MGLVCEQCQVEWGDELEACPDDGAALVDPLIGEMLGSYKVLKQLGRGGMGGVYLAEHPVIRSRVAVKVMHEKYASDEKIVDRFYNEARAVNVIGHDNVLKILDLSATASGRPYFVMELLEGQSLQALLDSAGAMPLEKTGPMLLQICGALQAAHEKNIVHRDLKPENIFLVTLRGQKNVVKVVDFGIARLTDSQGQSAGQTRTGMVMGTPAYMSPEQGSGATKQIDARSDIYSLGVIMYQLAAGRLPFNGKSFGELLAQHLQKQPLPPSNFNQDIPVEYEQIILQAMEKRQDDRFQTMEELGQAIRALLREKGIALSEPSVNPSSIRAKRPLPMSDTIPAQMQLDDGQTIPEGALFTPPAKQPQSVRAAAKRAPTGPPRTPTTPPRGPVSQPRGPISQPRAQGSQPRSVRAQPAQAAEPEHETHYEQAPARSPLKLWAMIGTATILASAAGFYLALRPRAPAPAADEPAVQAAAPLSFTITTEPAGAHVIATWQPSGSAQGDSPLLVHAPANSQLKLAIDLEGYASQVALVTAGGADMTFPFTLRALPEAAEPASRGGHRAKKPAERVSRSEEGAVRAKHDQEALINPF